MMHRGMARKSISAGPMMSLMSAAPMEMGIADEMPEMEA
jgi:hypothetical protein